MGETEEDNVGKLFENLVQASSCKGTLQAFNVLCRKLDLDPLENSTFYSNLKAKVTSWKAKALWSKLDKRMSHKEYKKGQACAGTKCLIIGGGPCGLRTAIELTLMGAKVVVIEKRDSFSRNNVLHLWPFTIHDLRGLGAKKFYGKFCAGAIDHISIQQLQLILLKVALIVGVEFHINVEFVKLLEPPEDQENEGLGWRAAIRPADHPVANFEFDVIIGADGRRNTLDGFKRKEFRGKLAIAITANFINRNTTAEAKVEEISGVAFIFNQKFFLDLKEETGIDLENIVYYRDNTHYFVMTAKKQSLLDKGVVINDYVDTQMLLSSENVNQEALLCYAREAADFGTNYQLPTLDFAMNHCGQPDVAMFDFTSMYASENAALVRERFGHQLLVALVGDSLLEPFWPMGTGCARGFLAAFDTAWMVKSWAQGRTVLEVLAERESIYRLLPQTTPENIAKNFDQYTIDPGTRYPNLNSSCVRPHQVRHLYISGEVSCSLERAASIRRPVNLCRRESEIRPARLLTWCQKQTEGYKNVTITDLTSSWLSGIAFCALIHRFKPQLIDFDSLNEEDHAANLQLAFDISEREFGIRPFTSGKELCNGQELDKTKMNTYLSKFYELFRGTPLPASGPRGVDENNDYPSKEGRSINNVLNLTPPRKRVPKDEKKSDGTDSIYKRKRKFCSYLEEATNLASNGSSVRDGSEPKENKVRSMATQLLARFESSPNQHTIRKQLDCERSSLSLQTLDLTEILHVKLRPVPPKPPLEEQSEADLRPAASHMFLRPPKPLPKPKLQTPQSQQPLSVVKLRHVDQTHAQTKPPPQPESAGPTAPSYHSAIQFMSRILERLREVDEHISEGGSVRRAFPQSNDKCHSCDRRVYMVERICAEGLYFHRECFRCSTCSSTLRQGAHAFDSEKGKLYCKLHFDQRNSGTNLRRNFSLRSNRSGAEVQQKPVTDEESSSVADPQSQSTGTFCSFVRNRMKWPLSVTRSVCNAPWYLSNCVRSATQAFVCHLRDNAQDYAFLYELLSMSVPMLLVFQEVLVQMYTEAVPEGPSPLQPLLQWLQDQIGHRLI
ncbi:F-actin-monooxygenase MICAL2 isoform X2 [Sphaeramia orbicularis]|uniref:F-actin-monooxygenase MICAL2 isoform X2 n=1 Tax=Sphaeramia orbicularis TaxID=375764 RepID=UPI001180C995|nr:F-actin-monooxygenase MICAL2 isoform X2 [Sphaeramia orbicularis]